MAAVLSTPVLDRAPIRYDPIGAAAAWTLAPLVGGIAVGYAILQSIVHRVEIVHPELAVVAIGLLAAAAVILAVAAYPTVGQLDRAAAFFIVGLAVLAAVLSSMSTWGHNRFVQDDWGQIGVAMLVFALLWLRPPWEIIVLGAFGAVVVGTAAAEQAGSLKLINTPYVYAVVAATPVLVLAAVAATSGAIIAHFSSEWMLSARHGIEALEPELRVVEEDALHRAQLDELRSATLPLLASIAERGEITPADIETAARVSAELREKALEDLRTGWIDGLIRDARLDPEAVHDSDHLLPHVPTRERAAVSACLIELARLGAIDPRHARITVQRAPTAESSERARFEAKAAVTADWRPLRRTARPFISVLRSFTGDASITRNGAIMILRFGFDPA